MMNLSIALEGEKARDGGGAHGSSLGHQEEVVAPEHRAFEL